jgi:plasmid stabilization system protein ParE
MRRVVWTIKASTSLDDYCAFIEKHSPTAARKVKSEIIQIARSLANNAENLSIGRIEK